MRPQGRENQLNRAYRLHIQRGRGRGRGRKIITGMTEVMTEADEILEANIEIETKEGVLYSEVDVEVRIAQRANTENKTIIKIKGMVDNKVSKVNLENQLKDLELL